MKKWAIFFYLLFSLNTCNSAEEYCAQQSHSGKKLLETTVLSILTKTTQTRTVKPVQPWLVAMANKASGYSPPVKTIATICYENIQKILAANKFCNIIRPAINLTDFDPVMYTSFNEALTQEEDRDLGTTITNLVQFCCRQHQQQLQEKGYEVHFKPHQETQAIGHIVNSVFETASIIFTEKKIDNLEKIARLAQQRANHFEQQKGIDSKRVATRLKCRASYSANKAKQLKERL